MGNTDSFDWSQFHKEYNLQKFYIFEAFEHIETRKIANGLESLYRLSSPNGLLYNCKLNWILAGNKIWDQTASLISARNTNSPDLEKYQQILDLLKNNQNACILYVYFEDSVGNTSLTNKTEKNESFVIFKGLENSIKDFLNTDNRLKSTIMTRFLVDKNEQKRMYLYKNIIQRIDVLGRFSDILVDTTSDKNYNIISLF